MLPERVALILQTWSVFWFCMSVFPRSCCSSSHFLHIWCAVSRLTWAGLVNLVIFGSWGTFFIRFYHPDFLKSSLENRRVYLYIFGSLRYQPAPISKHFPRCLTLLFYKLVWLDFFILQKLKDGKTTKQRKAAGACFLPFSILTRIVIFIAENVGYWKTADVDRSSWISRSKRKR